MKIHNAIVCDSVRKEDNGKLLIIGVYPADILVATFPQIVQLMFWVQFSTDQEGEIGIEFRVKKNREIISNGSGKVVVMGRRQSSIVTFPPTYINIDKECVLYFQLRLENEKWVTAKKIPAIKRPKSS